MVKVSEVRQILQGGFPRERTLSPTVSGELTIKAYDCPVWGVKDINIRLKINTLAYHWENVTYVSGSEKPPSSPAISRLYSSYSNEHF